MEKYPSKEIAEFTFKDNFTIIKNYRWSIFFITIFCLIIGIIYTYYKTNVYNSYSIIKVKPLVQNKSEELINRTISTQSKQVKEEINLLKTFKVNQKVLEKISFQVQYFKEDKYKKIEIYNNIPINIYDIKILDNDIIGLKLTVIPTKQGFQLNYFPSYKKQLQHKLFNSKLLTLDSSTIFTYGERVEHKFFSFRIEKKTSFQQPIHFKINGNTREIFEQIIKKNLHISQLEKDTSLIKISYQDNISSRAKLYVDTLTEDFITHSIKDKNQKNNKRLDFIVQELNDIKKELKESEQQLENYQISKSIVKPSVQGALFIKKLSNVEIELAENVLKKKLIINLLKFVQNNSNLDAIAPSLSKLGEQNTLHLITKVQDLQLKVEELSLKYTNEHPQLKSLEKQIINIRNKIEFNLKSLRTSIEYQSRSLKERKDTYESELKNLPSQERHLININRNYEVKSRMYEYLLKKEAENKIIQFATISDYQIVDYAYNSKQPIKSKKALIILISLLIGFFISFLLALLRTHINPHIHGQKDISAITHLPIYGVIPFYKQKNYRLQSNRENKSAFTEAFRTLRSNLQFLKKDTNGATTILISSTIAGEGKTTTSANLAAMFEKAKYKTLIINLDIRKPTLHRFFSINYNIGISNYLSDFNCQTDDIIFSTEFANLDIISSGPIVEDPSELILSKRLPLLLNELKNRYEYIIIDTAPIGIVSDTKTLIPYSDLTLIILRENYAKKEFIETIEEMIQKHKFKNVGFLLNASKTENGEYGYGYSYEYKH